MPVYRRVDKRIDDSPSLPPYNGIERSLLRWGEENEDAYTVLTAPPEVYRGYQTRRVLGGMNGQKFIDHLEAPHISMSARLLVWRIFKSSEKVKQKLTNHFQDVMNTRKACSIVRKKMRRITMIRTRQMRRLEAELEKALVQFSRACDGLIDAYDYLV